MELDNTPVKTVILLNLNKAVEILKPKELNKIISDAVK